MPPIFLIRIPKRSALWHCNRGRKPRGFGGDFPFRLIHDQRTAECEVALDPRSADIMPVPNTEPTVEPIGVLEYVLPDRWLGKRRSYNCSIWRLS